MRDPDLPRPSGPSGAPVVRLRRRPGEIVHPWVYRRMIRETPPGLRDGDEVIVEAADATPLGRGLYHAESTIAVRLLSRDPVRPLDAEFFRERIHRCLAFRRDVLALDRVTNAYRIVHGEGDGLSGVVVDRYDDLVVVEFFSAGMLRRREAIVAAIREQLPEARIHLRVDRASAEKEGLRLPPSETEGPSEEVEIRESKMRFLVDPRGHKTGFFLDQRDNRRWLAELVRGQDVLDTFAYTGGFAIAARTLGKARRVVAVDLDEDAVARGRRNASLNRAEIEWIHADAFGYLRRHRHAARPFDVICLDPPKWAARREAMDEAERRYIDLNTHALRAVRPGGLLVTSTCSGLVGEARFLRLLRQASAVAGRRIRVFRVAGAAPDHPVDLDCPESRYLTTVFARIEERGTAEAREAWRRPARASKERGP